MITVALHFIFQNIVEFIAILIILKAIILGSDFSFYHFGQSRMKYWKWYKEREKFAAYLIEEDIKYTELATRIKDNVDAWATEEKWLRYRLVEGKIDPEKIKAVDELFIKRKNVIERFEKLNKKTKCLKKDIESFTHILDFVESSLKDFHKLADENYSMLKTD